MVQLKVGQKVKIRADLEVGESYGRDSFVSDMASFRGEIVTVSELNSDDFRIEEDKHFWNFTPEMLDPTFQSKPEKRKLSQKALREVFGLKLSPALYSKLVKEAQKQKASK